MRHGVKRVKFNRNMGERKALMRSLLVALFTHEKIVTTEAKAKALRPVADSMISKSRTKSVATKRLLLSDLPHPQVVQKLLDDLGPHYASRVGGYSRITKLGRRLSDSSPMARIELIDRAIELALVETKTKKVKDTGPVEGEVVDMAASDLVDITPKESGKKSEREGKSAKEKAVSRRQVSTRKEGKK